MSGFYLSAIGDPNSSATWSGIPYYFLQEARRQGLVSGGLATETTGWRWRPRRILWNARRVLCAEHYGGYQYSTTFLENLFSPFQQRIDGASLIQCFQLLPPSIVRRKDVEKWFFIDMTLRQLFTEYGVGKSIGRQIAQEALERECAGYHQAAGVIVHSHWAAASVLHDYGVTASKIHVVVPGANFDASAYRNWEQQRPGYALRPHNDPLKLVFVGKYWRRKGLDRLLEGLEFARTLGLSATLRVIGCPQNAVPSELRTVRDVEWIGFLDKKQDMARFIDLLGQCDVGCLLSRAEAGGMALREYAALGLCTLATNVGGTAEHAGKGASVLLEPNAPVHEVGRALLNLSADRSSLSLAKERAWQLRKAATWQESVKQVRAILETNNTADDQTALASPLSTGAAHSSPF